MSFRAQRGQFIPVSHLRHQRRFFCRQKSTLSASSVITGLISLTSGLTAGQFLIHDGPNLKESRGNLHTR